MKFGSLHAYLDNTLPSTLKIKIKNFFSRILPFLVSPVNNDTIQLREQVNIAKNKKGEFGYISIRNKNYRESNNLWDYSPQEEEWLLSHPNHAPGNEASSPVQKANGVKPENPIASDKIIEQSQLIELQGLQIEQLNSKDKKNAALELIYKIGLDNIEDKKWQHFYIEHKADSLISTLIKLITQFTRDFESSREKRAFTFFLTPFREPTSDITSTFENINKLQNKYQGFLEKNSDISEPQPLKVCFAELAKLSNFYKKENLKEFTIKNVLKNAKELSLFYKKQDFKKKARHGAIRVISNEELAEMYPKNLPEGKTFCRNNGIKVTT